MSLALKARLPQMIPPGAGKKRQRGNPKPMVAFRAPEDIRTYFASVLEPGSDRSELIVKMLRVGRDCSSRMGAEWWEVERRANVEKRPVGEVLAELALAALATERKNGKK